MTLKLLSSICFVLVPSLVLAQVQPAPRWKKTPLQGHKHPLLCHTGDQSRCVLRLEPGEEAPIHGILQSFSQQAFLQVRADPKHIQGRIDLAVSTATKAVANDLNLEKTYRKIDNDAWAEKLRVTDVNHALQLDAVRPEWYESPIIVVPMTLLAVAGTVAVACMLNGCSQRE